MYLFAVAEINSHCSQIPTLKHDHKINCKISGISCLYAPLYVDCNGARCYHAMHDATTAHIIHCHPHPHIRKADPLILLQLRVLLLDAVLGDDEHLQAITNLNMPLRRAGERIRYECLDRRSVQQLGLPHHLLQTSAGVGVVLVLEVDLVVQERCDQTARSTSSTARLALVAAHGIVRVQSAHAVLVQTSKDRVHVVREEALVVEDVAEALGAGVDAHLLVVLVLVHLDDSVEALLERVAISGEADDGEHDLGALVVAAGAADAEQFGSVARVDVVAAGAASVACEDGEVGAGDAEGCAAVVCVAVLDELVEEVLMVSFIVIGHTGRSHVV